MAVTNDTLSSGPAMALTGALTSAHRALDVTRLVLDYNSAEPGALVELLARAWDAGAAASDADHTSRRSRRSR